MEICHSASVHIKLTQLQLPTLGSQEGTRQSWKPNSVSPQGLESSFIIDILVLLVPNAH